MFPFAPKPKSKLQKEIDLAFEELRNHDMTSEKYATVLDRVAKMQKLQAETARKPLSPDTMVSAGANLLGIMLIIRHENLNVITSKALNFVGKTK